MLLFGHHRRHKLACFLHVSHLVLFVSLILVHFRSEKVLCVLKGFGVCGACGFFSFVSKKCDVVFFFGLVKFCDVIAGAFGVSGCIPLRTVLRDVTFVVQFLARD